MTAAAGQDITVSRILTELNMTLNTSLTVAQGRTSATRRANAYNTRDSVAVVGVTSYNTVTMEAFPVWQTKVDLLRQALKVYDTVWYVVAHSNQDGTVIGVQYIPGYVLIDYLDNAKTFFEQREGSTDMAAPFLPVKRPGGFLGVGVDALHQFTEARHPEQLPYMEAKWQEVVSHYNLSLTKVTQTQPQLPSSIVEQEVIDEVAAAVVVTTQAQVTAKEEEVVLPRRRASRRSSTQPQVAYNGSTWDKTMQCYVDTSGFRDFTVDPATGEEVEDWA